MMTVKMKMAALLPQQVYSFKQATYIISVSVIAPFNNTSVKSGQRVVDSERLCAMQPHLQLRRYLPQAGLEPGNARLVGQRMTY